MKPSLRKAAGKAAFSAKRAGLVALGVLMLAFGIIGAFLPVMPTTIFLILAAWCFGRSSPRIEAWMLNHPRFGPTLRDWRQYGAVPRKAKIVACLGMASGYGLFFAGARPEPLLAVVVAAFVVAAAIYVTTRPERLGTASAADGADEARDGQAE
ncbi:YbaN family protein [Aminobacter anthyllidis]|uniref:YbaN family protein n=1 Tax=Aminobacter anthyllidis TaxID=1035067 RepID=A0A9X1A9Y8_9HYPH|nr:YbaN family protein [Aminobacter anthyllidis]MBT1155954.1 YbaN family protein [Aminobacter anthyllidis]